MTFKDIPAWYWMFIIAVFVFPMAYSIVRNGIKAKIETKLGSAEFDADNESADEKRVSPAENKPVE